MEEKITFEKRARYWMKTYLENKFKKLFFVYLLYVVYIFIFLYVRWINKYEQQ
jgi:hypothetical protein